MDRNIIVNGRSFKAYTFDSHNIILLRYCLQDEKTIPFYYHFFDTTFMVEEGAKCAIDSLKLEMDTYVQNLDSLSGIDYIHSSSIFPNLTQKEMVLFYLDKNNVKITPEVQKKLREYNKDIFASERASSNMLETHRKMIEEERYRLKLYLSNYEHYAEIINAYPPMDSEELVVEGTDQTILFHYQTKVSFVDIFDAIIVSEVIPFVYVYINGSYYFKIHKNFEIPSSWDSAEEIGRAKKYTNYLYFKILNEPEKENGTFSEDNYSDASWNIEKGVEIKFNKKVNMDAIKKSFFDSIDASLLGRETIFSDEGIRETGIRSTFKIPNFAIEKVIFSDMICNDDVLSFFLFLKEYQSDPEDKVLTSTLKNRFMLYFNPGKPGELEDTLSITANSYEEMDEEYTIIRIAKSDTFLNASNFQKIFCLLLTYYQKNYKKYLDIYRELIPDYVDMIRTVKKIKKIKEDQKTGKRLTTLKKEEPYIFRSGYSGLCQPRSRQPYKVPPSKVEDLREKLGEHKIMAYPHPQDPTNILHYACEPREEGEEGTYIYPGLRKNDSKKNPKYDEEVPYIPCCFSEDQYTKPGSALKKILEDQKKEDRIVENVNEISHVLAFNKQTPVGRYGKIPHYLNFIAKQAKIPEIERGKQKLYPIFRYGVIACPDSFFHCLERAFNIAYTSQFTFVNRRRMVMQSRQKMAEKIPILCGGKQELYDYSIEDIQKILLDENAYIDPGWWIRIAEEYYGCNILLFQISAENPYGAFLYPRYSKVCIHKDLDKNRPTVIIAKFEREEDSEEAPFQSELFVKFNPDKKIEGAKVKFSFETSQPFIQRFYENYIRSFYNYFSTGYVEQLRVVPYDSIIWKGVTKQYIDSYGKARMLLYHNKIPVYVFPMHPIPVPCVFHMDQYSSIELEDAKQFVESYGLSSQPYVNGWMVFNEHFIGYISIEGISKKISNSSERLPLYLEGKKDSRLEKYRLHKKIAMLLQQHTLYLYSLHAETFSRDLFVVIPGYEYDEDRLDKILDTENGLYDENGRLIVTSQEMLDKLLIYLQTRLLNDRYSILRFKQNSTVEKYYQTIKDFHFDRNQYIIKDVQNYVDWRELKKNKPYLIRSEVHLKIEEPYFYRNGRIKPTAIFILQNVKDGLLEKALQVSNVWLKEKRNIGSNPSVSQKIDPLFFIAYSEEGEILEGSDPTAPLLLYKNGRYAALLEI